MQRIVYLVLTLTLICFATARSTTAQSTIFTYQGSINASGTPASGNHDFEFAIFDGGGVQVGSTLTRLNVPVSSGSFAVELDFGSQFPGADRFLEIRVRTAGGGAFTTLAPRQAIRSTPHAIRSLDSAQLGGVPASQYFTANSAVITATSQFNIGNFRVLSAPPGSSNTFVGLSTGPTATGVQNTVVGSGSGFALTTGTGNSFYGAFSGDANTTGTHNAFYGLSSGGSNTTGEDNAFFGAFSGVANSVGERNAFFGASAGFNNTANNNSFFGYSSGQSNTTGSNNAFFGIASGQLNTEGNRNSFFGSNAGGSNTTGNVNSFFGANAGDANTVGTQNAFFGADSGRDNTTGIDNAYFGFRAGKVGQTNGGNAFFGAFAGEFNTASANTFVGNLAGNANTTAGSNAFFGASSGKSNTTGANNSFFGAGAGIFSTVGNDNSFFGTLAGAQNGAGGRNSFFGKSAGAINAGGNDNAFFGVQAGDTNTSGDGNSFFGKSAGNGNSTGNFLTMLGFEAKSTNALVNATAIGFRSFVAQDNSLVLGGIAGLNGAANDTNVGIGTPTPSARLHVVGSGLFTGNLTVGGAINPGGTLTSTTINAATQFNLNGNRVFAMPGTANLFVGLDSGLVNATGTSNSFFGSGTGQDNTSGSENSFFGLNTGRANTSGNRNTYFGRLAGRFNTTGDDNTSIGYNAGSGNTSGNEITAVGSRADAGNASLVNATAIGARALVTTSNSLVLGSINGINGASVNTRVGIGTTAPTNRLTIGEPETTIINGAVGIFNAGGTFMTLRDTTNNVEALIGSDSNGALFGSMSDSFVRIRTNNINRMNIAPDGSVGFTGSVTIPTAVVGLDTGGSTSVCRTVNGVLATCSSSARYKSNINPFTSGLSLIKRLNPVSFNWLTGGMADLGLVAEDVASAEPLLTTSNDKGQVEGVKYDRVGVVLVNAVKEQQAQIESQRDMIATQQREIGDLRSQVEAMRRLLCSIDKKADICKEN